MPDRNEPDFSPSFPAAIRSMYTFSTYSFDDRVLVDFSAKFPSGLKGVEIQADSHDVFDRDIRHALSQLRYAMPDLLVRHLTATLFGHPDDCKPIFIMPLLVTTAELRILNEDVSVDKVRASDSLDDISTAVAVVDVHSPYAEDFRQHCKQVFADLTSEHFPLRERMAIVRIGKYHKDKDKSYVSPVTDLGLFEHGYGPSPGFFSQFLVVKLEALPALLTEVNQVVCNSLRDSKQFVFPETK